jgi:hypothetical protein
MATLQGKAVKNTYRQVLQIGANNVGVSASLQPVQDGAGVNTALSLSTNTATINGTLTITGDLIITGGGIQIQDLIDDTVASLIQNGTGITWTYNDGARTLTGNFTGTTSVVPEGSNLYYTQGRFDSAFAAKSTTNLAEGANLYFTEARGNANFATNFATKTTTNLPEGTNLYFTDARTRLALSITAGTGIAYNNTTGVFNLAAIPNASLANSSITINGQAVSLGGTVTLTTTNIGEGTNLYWTEARGNSNFTTNLAASSTTNLAEGSNLYYTQARFDTAFSNKSTTNLAEGTNLYYTQARFNSALAAKTTTDLAEGTNLYYTDARARLALASSATGLTYANNSGVFSLTAGYAIPTTVKLGQYDTAYNRSIVSAAVTGTTTKTLSLTQQDANVVSATWTDLGITTINGTANQIATTTVGNTTTVAFTNDVTMPNNLVVSGNLTINGTATYVNTQSISAKDPLFEVANDNNTTDAVDIGYYGRYYDTPQTRVEFTGLFRDASDAGKFKFFTGLVDEPTNVVNTTGTGYTVGTLVANFEGNLAGTANAANALSTARTIAASGDAVWSVSFDGSANVSSALTLANTGVTATTYGTSTSVPTIAVDSKGRITSASNTNITFPVTTVNGFAGTVVLTTSDVSEGTNQYFTTARAQAAITGGASSVVTANLTASRALVSDGSGKIAASATTTTTEVGYLAGVTSAIQTQLNGKLNLTGGTLTGGLIGTTGSFSSSGSGDTFTIGHTSGSGIALNITKGGNGEGLYINKTSGSGNAATIIGTLNATTLVKSGGTASQFLMADGSVNTSVLASGAYLPLAGGTLTGALGGTSATFSSSVTANGLYVNAGNSTRFYRSANDYYWGINNDSNNFLNFATFAADGTALGTNPKLIIQDNGVAIFTSNSNSTITNVFQNTNTTDTNSRNYLNVVAGNVTTSIQAIHNDHSYINVTNNLYFQSSGGVKMLITSGGNVGIGTSSPSDKLVVSDGTVNWYVGPNTANSIAFNGTSSNHALGFVTNGNERMRITSGGNVQIGGTTGSNSRLYVKGSSSDGTTNALLIHDSSSNDLFFVRTDGLILTGSRSASPYNLSTTGRNAVIESNGVLGYTSSTRESKINIEQLSDVSWLYQLNPVSFNYRKKDDEMNYTDEAQDEKWYGLIADEVEGVNQDLVFYNVKEDGTKQLAGVEYNKIIAALIKSSQEQQAQIEELKAMIAAK